MAHSGPTSDAPLRLVSNPRATERSGAPLPAAAAASAEKYPFVKVGTERYSNVAVSRSPSVTGVVSPSPGPGSGARL
jgi:hypothetical protein